MIYEKKFKMLLLKCFIINKKDTWNTSSTVARNEEGEEVD